MRVHLSILYFYCSIKLLNATIPDIPIIPLPQEVEIYRGYFLIRPENTAIKTAVSDTTGIFLIVNQLKHEFYVKYGQTPVLTNGREYTIWLGIPDQDEIFKNYCSELNIWPEHRISDEGYILIVEKKQIIIAANSEAGLFYGVQSLKQLLRGWPEPGRIPQLKIVDWPDMRYRGIQDDISRGPVPSMEFMKEQIKRIAELKMNTYSCYTEHIIKTEKHGDFAPSGGAITLDEWQEITAFSEKYYIQTIGNFQSLGHFEKILSFSQYAHLGETDRMLSPVNDESINLLRDIYTEMIPVFSSTIFNVNCDETWDFGRGGSKQAVDSLGVGRVYADYIKKLYRIIKNLHRRMMIWGDIALEHEEILTILPKDIILGAWDYSAGDSFTHFFLPFKKGGFDFMISPGVLNSNRLMPDYKMTFTNIKNFVHDGIQNGALGLLLTIWDDGGITFFTPDWYGIAYGADHGWNSNDATLANFNQRFNLSFYGDKAQKIAQALQTLTQLTDLAPTQEMNEAIFWKTLVPNRGEQLKLSLVDWDKVLALTEEAEGYLGENQASLRVPDIAYLNFIINQYRYMTKSRFAVLEAAQAYRQASLLQKESCAQARGHLIKALQIITELKLILLNLRNYYQNLWLQENRIYWLDRNLALYDAKISDYTGAEQLLKAAIEDFDKGFYLPAPSEIRLAIEETQGQYFQYWLLCGPFPNINWSGREVDYLTALGGEPGVKPRPGLSFKSPGGEPRQWFKYSSPNISEINLSSIFEQNREVLAYAYCSIESPDDRKVLATFGSNDGIQIFLNGKLIYKNFVMRSLKIDEDRVLLSLKKGKNHLLLKIDQNNGEWGISFRLPEEVIRNHKQKYRIIR